MTHDERPDPRADATVQVLPVVRPGMTFDVACAAVLTYLQEHVPMGLWAVTRVDGDDQVVLEVGQRSADGYGVPVGTSVSWEDSFCRRMTQGSGQVVPDVEADEGYRDTPNRGFMPVESYVGVPLALRDGALFGALCGFSPHRAADAEALRRQEPLLVLLGSLLSAVLAADLERAQAERTAQWQELRAESDVLTDLLNRRGWDRALAAEEQRHHRFGDPGAVIILDLDRLKTINDTLGHAAGDAHLRVAAAALRATVRETDVLARLGGDEFGVLATRSSRSETLALVGRLRETLDSIGVPASIGSAPLVVGAGLTDAWSSADARMYVDKEQRRLSSAS